MAIRLPVYLLVFLISSCQGDTSRNLSAGVDDSAKEIFLEVGNPEEIFDLTKYVSQVQEISLSGEYANKFGVINFFHVVEGEGVILVDAGLAKVLMIDFSGDIVWEIEADYDEYNIHGSIKYCSFNSDEKVFSVLDGREIFQYSFDGVPLGKLGQPVFGFANAFSYPVGDSDGMLYSNQGFPNDFLEDSEHHNKQIMLYDNEEDHILASFVECYPLKPEFRFIKGYLEFTTLDKELLYHSPIREECYRVGEFTVKQDFFLRFLGEESTNRITEDQYIESNLGYTLNNNIAFGETIAASDERIFVIYRKSGNTYNALFDRRSENWMFNNQFFILNKSLVKAANLYDNNYLMTIESAYLYDHSKVAYADGEKVDSAWKGERDRIVREEIDAGPRVIRLWEL
ncbi:MAG: hypothetical protein AAGF87_12015 [Bacteroidota bacterium]